MNYGGHIRSPSPTINVLKSITPQREGICQGVAKKKSAAMLKSGRIRQKNLQKIDPI
jgi:hypothetical protein